MNRNVTIFRFDCTITELDTEHLLTNLDSFGKYQKGNEEKKNKILKNNDIMNILETDAKSAIKRAEFIAAIFGNKERIEFLNDTFQKIKTKGDVLILVAGNIDIVSIVRESKLNISSNFDLLQELDFFSPVPPIKPDIELLGETLAKKHRRYDIDSLIQNLFDLGFKRIVYFDHRFSYSNMFKQLNEQKNCTHNRNHDICVYGDKTLIVYTNLEYMGNGLQPHLLNDAVLAELYGIPETLWYVAPDDKKSGFIYATKPDTMFRECVRGKKPEGYTDFDYFEGEILGITTKLDEDKVPKDETKIHYCQNDIQIRRVSNPTVNKGGNMNTYVQYQTNKHAYSILKHNI